MKKILIILGLVAIEIGMVCGLIALYPYTWYIIHDNNCYDITYQTTYDHVKQEYIRIYTYRTKKLNQEYICKYEVKETQENKLGKTFVEKQLLKHHKFYKKCDGTWVISIFILLGALFIIYTIWVITALIDLPCNSYKRCGYEACINCSKDFCYIYHKPFQYTWIKQVAYYIYINIKKFFGYEKVNSNT